MANPRSHRNKGPARRAPSGHVLLGRIGAAHGIKGEVRIKSFTEDPMALGAYGPLVTDRPGLVIEIGKARLNKAMVIATIKGVTDRNAAEALNGVGLYVPRDSLPETEDEDEFYHTDLIGLTARTEAGETLGTVTAIFNHGPNDILEIKPEGAPSVLVPFTRQVVPTIRLKDGYLIIDPPLGVFEDVEDEPDETRDEDPAS